MTEDLALRASPVVCRQSTRCLSIGFVDPLYMIFVAAVATGLSLVLPIAVALYRSEVIQLWHWICFGLGIAVLAGCVAFIVREHRE